MARSPWAEYLRWAASTLGEVRQHVGLNPAPGDTVQIPGIGTDLVVENGSHGPAQADTGAGFLIHAGVLDRLMCQSGEATDMTRRFQAAVDSLGGYSREVTRGRVPLPEPSVYTNQICIPATNDLLGDWGRLTHAPETEEQRQARVAEGEERDRARARSLMLLAEHLTDEQMAQWKEHEHFEVETGGKRRYRITNAATYNVHRLNDEGHPIKKYCVVPQGLQWPIGDQLVMQLLLLKTDEAGFLAEANVQDDDD